MSAQPQFSAIVNPDYVGGLVLYKDHPVGVDFSKIVTIRQFKIEPLDAGAVVVMTITSGPAGVSFPTAASTTIPGYGPYLYGTPTANGSCTALIQASVYRGTDSGNVPAGLLGSCYFALPFTVQDAPTAGTAGTNPVTQIILGDLALTAGKAAAIQLYTRTDVYSSTWRVTGLPEGLTANYNNITGTPITAGAYSVTLTLIYKLASDDPPVEETKVVTFTVAAGVPVISAPNGPYDATYPCTAEMRSAYALQLCATGSPTAWDISGAPTGIAITNAGLISGSVATPGIYMMSVTATNAAGTSAPKLVQLTVTEPSTPSYLEDGAVDVFFDLQTRALSLTPPKAETVISEGQTVLNAKDGSTLMLKSGETLWLNVRFVKGTRVIDPVATGIRFGVACQVGGPLVMEGAAFTKVGSGSATYHKIRVPVSDAEFSSIAGDYFDEDKVETPDAPTAATSEAAQIKGLCEIELTTGSGETIAKIKSDTMPVILSRSILA